MPYFVFLEFASPAVRKFLQDLRTALNREVIASPIHITLRGPYERSPQLEQIEALAKRMRGYGVKIRGEGYFNTPRGFAIFLRAECSVFRELWHKPDFPGSTDAIQPHITIFESSNRSASQDVRDFLKSENIFIHTYDVYLKIYQSRLPEVDQPDMFGQPIATPGGKPISRDLWRLRPAVLERAQKLGDRIHAPKPVVRI